MSRQTTLELAGELGIPVREANLGRYDAVQADELFVTATTCSLCHAVTLEGRPVGDGRPGPEFRRLLEAWNRLVGVDFVAQAQAYAKRMTAWEAAR